MPKPVNGRARIIPHLLSFRPERCRPTRPGWESLSFMGCHILSFFTSLSRLGVHGPGCRALSHPDASLQNHVEKQEHLFPLGSSPAPSTWHWLNQSEQCQFHAVCLAVCSSCSRHVAPCPPLEASPCMEAYESAAASGRGELGLVVLS